MPIPTWELVSGVVDGVNTTYSTSKPYTAGTLVVFINGQAQWRYPEFCDGFMETNPATGEFEIPEAPSALQEEDVIQAFYLDTSPVLPETVLCKLRGTLREFVEAKGTLIDPDLITGKVETKIEIRGLLATEDFMSGELNDTIKLYGNLSEVCA